jgi:hypothetical protein
MDYSYPTLFFLRGRLVAVGFLRFAAGIVFSL